LKSFRPARLTTRRKELGLTQQKMAYITHLSTVTISNIENGKKQPRAGTVARLADALRCNVDYFFG
jgi:transcriptional regulator with XRE-family HTH domain